MRSLVACLVGAVAMLVSGGLAHAAWVRVETDKFIVYGRSGEASVRAYAARLDAYDQVLRRFHPSTANRKRDTKVQVIMVRTEQELQRVRPTLRRGMAGFYTAMNEGVFAFAVRGGQTDDDLIFHEYAHHFMRENFPAAYPAWFVEGFAEYFMTTDIKPGQIVVGGYNEARAYGVLLEPWLPMEQLLSKTTSQTNSQRLRAYYGQAWLLMHYMRSDPTRAGQLDMSIEAIADGADPVKALQDATGMTMVELARALRGYTRLKTMTFKSASLGPPAMTVTTMPDSADELFLDNIRLILSPTGRVDAQLLAEVRRKGARYPGDRLSEAALARAEFLMGDVAVGEAIMKRRLAAAPDDVEDLLLAGWGQLMAGQREKPRQLERYRAARPLLVKAYRLNRTDFRPLYAYALSRSVEPEFPTENDLSVLLEARSLAPSVVENSYRAGMALLAKGRREDAAKVLAAVTNDPHGGQAAAEARKLLSEGRIGAANIEPPSEDEATEKPPAPPAK